MTNSHIGDNFSGREVFSIPPLPKVPRLPNGELLDLREFIHFDRANSFGAWWCYDHAVLNANAVCTRCGATGGVSVAARDWCPTCLIELAFFHQYDALSLGLAAIKAMYLLPAMDHGSIFALVWDGMSLIPDLAGSAGFAMLAPFEGWRSVDPPPRTAVIPGLGKVALLHWTLQFDPNVDSTRYVLHYSEGEGTQLLTPPIVPQRYMHLLGAAHKAATVPSRIGRPRGTGCFSSAQEFESVLHAAIAGLRKQGRKPTQEHVAAFFCGHSGYPLCNTRQLRAWCASFGVSWASVSTDSSSGQSPN